MDLGQPIRSVIPSITGSVLAVLARTNEPLTGRELEAHVKPTASHRGVQLALEGLVSAGVVDRVTKGRSALYTLNREHVATDGIVALASMRDGLLRRMKSAIGAWKVKVQSATLFGSFARGDGGPASDIDLLLVRRDAVGSDDMWDQQLAQLSSDVLRWSGNPLRTIVLTELQLVEEFGADEAYLNSAAREGIALVGTPLRRLRATVAR
jgi:predicted nucleotidyltransferase